MATARSPSPPPGVDAAPASVEKQPAANAATHTPSDSLVSVSLSESAGRASRLLSADASPIDVVHEVLRRASSLASDPASSPTVHDGVDSPGAEARLVEEVAREKARSRRASLTASKNSSVRARSDSTGSDSSIVVDWDTLDKTEHMQDAESDEVGSFRFKMASNRSSKLRCYWRAWSKKTQSLPPIPSPARRPAAALSRGRRRSYSCTSSCRSRARAPSASRCCRRRRP